jgi:hypothetical protein
MTARHLFKTYILQPSKSLSNSIPARHLFKTYKLQPQKKHFYACHWGLKTLYESWAYQATQTIAGRLKTNQPARLHLKECAGSQCRPDGWFHFFTPDADHTSMNCLGVREQRLKSNLPVALQAQSLICETFFSYLHRLVFLCLLIAVCFLKMTLFGFGFCWCAGVEREPGQACCWCISLRRRWMSNPTCFWVLPLTEYQACFFICFLVYKI